jgi:hypothetical protein
LTSASAANEQREQREGRGGEGYSFYLASGSVLPPEVHELIVRALGEFDFALSLVRDHHFAPDQHLARLELDERFLWRHKMQGLSRMRG